VIPQCPGYKTADAGYGALIAGSPYSSQVTKNWADFLAGADRCAHAVQIYADLDELADSVATYLARGFEAGDPAVVVATADHAARFLEKLAARGWDADRTKREAFLRIEDADVTLAAIMQGGANPSPAAFEQVVGDLLDDAAKHAPGRDVRAFGEMVDLLTHRGDAKAAVELEELWNDLARRRRFSLLCGYRLDVFDRAAQVGTLPDVCRAHSHVLPASDSARLARSVDLALEEVLGAAEAGKVYALVGEQIRRGRVPSPQLVLMWVSANMPALADRVLASARRRYVDAVPA
jgi:MEDS: MEthanogen/methylotroph, DcmR Sensory domain